MENKSNHNQSLTKGIYDNNIKAKDVIRKLSFSENCDIIYSGVIPPNPTELLKNGRLGNEQAKGKGNGSCSG